VAAESQRRRILVPGGLYAVVLKDDGIVNTSDALIPGDFNRELSRSLLDRRHRFAFSGTFDTPRILGHLRISPIVRIASGAPFNLSLGGVDRNLDDVSNDRPNFTGDPSLLQWRRPGEPIDPSILNFFSLPAIGQSGNLPRNAGTGPGQFIFDLNVSREFRLNEKMRMRWSVEFDNVLNTTVFSSAASSSTSTRLVRPRRRHKDKPSSINSSSRPAPCDQDKFGSE